MGCRIGGAIIPKFCIYAWWCYHVAGGWHSDIIFYWGFCRIAPSRCSETHWFNKCICQLGCQIFNHIGAQSQRGCEGLKRLWLKDASLGIVQVSSLGVRLNQKWVKNVKSLISGHDQTDGLNFQQARTIIIIVSLPLVLRNLGGWRIEILISPRKASHPNWDCFRSHRKSGEFYVHWTWRGFDGCDC